MITALLFAVYAAASAALVIYGANCYVLVVLFLRRHRLRAAETATLIAKTRECFDSSARLPRVATQIPLYNEANVAERVMRAAAAIDYPAELHEIQVLDDSTDETRGIVDRVARDLRGCGHRVAVLRRSDRNGFKAGALAAGLEQSDAEFVAIFDADFVPPRHFLRHEAPLHWLRSWSCGAAHRVVVGAFTIAAIGGAVCVQSDLPHRLCRRRALRSDAVVFRLAGGVAARAATRRVELGRAGICGADETGGRRACAAVCETRRVAHSLDRRGWR
ncbi:MAG: glycosyltransferase [Verrucomicrobia bacterium]|nr:glycosyltransferase [Verrucomicrobiota bacterium]